MDFVFRMPLLFFDITQQDAIDKNYQQILNAIRYSSEDFYHQIKDRSMEELSEKEKRTLFKFLLRGRYRPTPFGLWAGIGVGTWSDQFTIEEGDLEQYPISKGCLQRLKVLLEESHHLKSRSFGLNPMVTVLSNYYHLWEFDIGLERWNDILVERNNVLDHVHDYLKEDNPFISYTIFQSWFPSSDGIGDELFRVWKTIVHSGFLNIFNVLDNEDPKENADPSFGVNTYLPWKLSQSLDIKNQLHQIPKETGMLMEAVKHPFLDCFKRAFHQYYDDRMVPLNKLLGDTFLWKKCNANAENDFHSKDQTSTNVLKDKILSRMHKREGWESINLRDHVKAQPIHYTGALQIMYRLGYQGSILIDGIHTTEGFPLIGRFTSVPKLIQMGKILHKKRSQGSNRTQYMDVTFFENEKSNMVMEHVNLVENSFSIFGMKGKSGDIALNDILIGIKGEKFVLIHQNSGDRIIPVIQHALNPNCLSHPLSKLFYDIAQQDRFQLNSIMYDSILLHSHIPRLEWGDIVLQPAKWRISSHEIRGKSPMALYQYFQEKMLPRYLLIGHGDVEILIDTFHRGSLELLESEASKSPSLIVKECLWIKGDHYKVKNELVYPQFVYEISRPFSIPRQAPTWYNRLLPASEQWVSWKVYLPKELFEIFLIEELTDKFIGSNENRLISNWFYMIYKDDDFHIRIRIKVNQTESRKGLIKQFLFFLYQCPIISRFEPHPYYPEYSKYGKKGMGISEDIFHMESQHFCYFKPSPAIKPNHLGLKASFEDRVKFAVLSSVLLLEKCGLAKEFLRDIKTAIMGSSITSSEKEQNVKFFSLHFSAPDLSAPWIQEFISPYIEKYLSHPEINGTGAKVLVSNHLHLFYNRLFLTKAPSSEPLIHYCIYRLLSKMLHTGCCN